MGAATEGWILNFILRRKVFFVLGAVPIVIFFMLTASTLVKHYHSDAFVKTELNKELLHAQSSFISKSGKEPRRAILMCAYNEETFSGVYATIRLMRDHFKVFWPFEVFVSEALSWPDLTRHPIAGLLSPL